jgi:dipeptidyl aminopeptidase/acylaminoacyl peptidase
MKQHCPRESISRSVLIAAASVILALQPARAEDLVAKTRELLHDARARAAERPRAGIVSRDRFLTRPAISNVALAPDGLHVSYLEWTGDEAAAKIVELASGRRMRAAAGLRGAECAWSGDGRRLWIADARGLAVAAADDFAAKRILEWETRKSQRLWAVDASAADYAILYEREGVLDETRHRYILVDTAGTKRTIVEAKWPLLSILLDGDGGPKFVAAYDGARYETVVRQYGPNGARDLMRLAPLEDCRLLGYEGDGTALWLLARHDGDKIALRRCDTTTDRCETMHVDPDGLADVDAALWSAARRTWQAIAYHAGHRRWRGNDAVGRETIARLESRFPDDNLELSASSDGAIWLVRAQRAQSAKTRYYTYSAAEDRLREILGQDDAEPSTELRGAAANPVTYEASDGFLVHGYVWLPDGIALETAPLVTWLHGGPIARVYDRWDPLVQLLVNRGCIVFAPNFRGSSGYGARYTLAAGGDVGNGRVLADVIEGIDFLLEQGIGDTRAQAVMGMSFGGYASLLAVSHHPNRFRCAVAAAPPTDYGWAKEWQAENESGASRADGPPLAVQFEHYGFRYRDAGWRDRMRRESPLAMIDALQAPLYLWAGARDERVPQKSVTHFVATARRGGAAISFLVDPTAGHVPNDDLGNEALLYLVELAVHRHLAGALDPPAPELERFLERNLRVDDRLPDAAPIPVGK